MPILGDGSHAAASPIRTAPISLKLTRPATRALGLCITTIATALRLMPQGFARGADPFGSAERVPLNLTRSAAMRFRVPNRGFEVILAQGSTFQGPPACSSRAGTRAPNARRPVICMSCTWHIHPSHVRAFSGFRGFRCCRCRCCFAAWRRRSPRHRRRLLPSRPVRPRAGT
jgi:hypothetical protein